MRKIVFDKVEVELKGHYQTAAERRFSLPKNHHLEIGKVLQVGHTVEEIKKGDLVLFLTVSKNPVSGKIAYLREREVLFTLDEENDEVMTLGDDVRIEKIDEEERLLQSGIVLPTMAKDGVLAKGKVTAVNPNKNSLGLKKGDNIWYKEKNGERVLEYDQSVLLHEPQIIYRDA